MRVRVARVLLLRRVMKVGSLMFLLLLAAVLGAGCLPQTERRPEGEPGSAIEHHRTGPDAATARCQEFSCSR